MTTQFLECLLPGFQLLRLEHEEIETEGHHITVNVYSTQALVHCPVCTHPTTRIHSRYERTLADLPCVNYSLTLVMQVSKFFCDIPLLALSLEYNPKPLLHNLF